MQIEVKPGVIYLFKSKEDGRVRELTSHLRSAGYRLMVVSARTSSAVKDELDIPTDCILTLTESNGQYCVDPQNLMVLTDSIVKHIERKGQSALLIDDLGPLTHKNEFSKILRFVGFVYEYLAMNRGIGIMVVDPTTVNEKDMALLSKEGYLVEERDRLGTESLVRPDHLENRPSQNV